jgi:hypothetical protein
MLNNRSPFTQDQLTRFAEAVVGGLRTPMVIIDRQLQILAASPPLELQASDRVQGAPVKPDFHDIRPPYS